MPCPSECVKGWLECPHCGSDLGRCDVCNSQPEGPPTRYKHSFPFAGAIEPGETRGRGIGFIPTEEIE